MLLKHFWKRWSNKNLPILAMHYKWYLASTILKIGDVCLISEENRTQPNCSRGRTIEAIPSIDSLIRTHNLKTN